MLNFDESCKFSLRGVFSRPVPLRNRFFVIHDLDSVPTFIPSFTKLAKVYQQKCN